jgi:hypothetical protein
MQKAVESDKSRQQDERDSRMIPYSMEPGKNRIRGKRQCLVIKGVAARSSGIAIKGEGAMAWAGVTLHRVKPEIAEDSNSRPSELRHGVSDENPLERNTTTSRPVVTLIVRERIGRFLGLATGSLLFLLLLLLGA